MGNGCVSESSGTSEKLGDLGGCKGGIRKEIFGLSRVQLLSYITASTRHLSYVSKHVILALCQIRFTTE